MIWLLGLSSWVGAIGVLQLWISGSTNGPLALWILAVAVITGPAALGNAVRIWRLTQQQSRLRVESRIATLFTAVFYLGLLAYLARM